jgi:3-oxoadipate enol-lactonase
MRASIHMDRGIQLESIRCLVHIVSSDLDTVYSPSMARQMQQRIPSARLTCIEGAGHLSYLEQPLAFHEAIRGFLVEQVEHHVL